MKIWSHAGCRSRNSSEYGKATVKISYKLKYSCPFFYINKNYTSNVKYKNDLHTNWKFTNIF